MTATASEVKRTKLRRLITQIDIDEQMRLRAVQSAITEAEADHWRKRAADFDQARPQPLDYKGAAATPAGLAEADRRCAGVARACRRKAAFLDCEAGGPLIDPAEEVSND
jgi:hypothetical protein